jgi:dTDP-glucose 4,6-dehydratase
MQNILVTGGAGFIGSNFVHYLLHAEPNAQVVNLDVLTYAGSLENLRGTSDSRQYAFVHGDICDSELVRRLLRTYRIDTIVHFAAESHVDRSIIAPEQFIRTNIVGTYTLLEQARGFWMTEKPFPRESVRFHHVSTDEVYGSLAADAPAFSETTPYAPNSPYAASKASSDHLVRSYAHTYGMPVTISNCSNNYGPRQFPEKLIPLIILNALARKSLPIYGDGQQIRDWLYVTDHCEAIHKILMLGRPGETYNIGGGNQPANLGIVETICDLLDEVRPPAAHHKLITFVADRPGHDRRYAMNIAKIEKDLGWRPSHSLADGLRETVEWYLANSDWATVIQKQQEYQRWLGQNYQERERQS